MAAFLPTATLATTKQAVPRAIGSACFTKQNSRSQQGKKWLQQLNLTYPCNSTHRHLVIECASENSFSMIETITYSDAPYDCL
ncbi:MAG: hypothetical protein JGK01_15770 [Microcoleus sp. PH2017_03_ELD_O_A]|jgi:hypothetical protein|uniref:hypothetical protein n=1 Tax=Microcoleus sp. PH2017_32_RDM_D_A TaxID=2798842 RepID=UPI001DB8CF30|nr:hypothetical protein [Microcoleus sp. PH2017_32_RDM_D_A]MCC3443199.1 hypothetical protein [Microcoleus sp. PH2017_03_ELD_O_A]MCC3476166.1 hypothetical protein [Microcoleus sp. PH2017_13_LAR_U_A]MCC3502601.1 hypothetical protein [Microcoleus sp. PH2017_19_SFW_U_A]MCC3557182.1 hypothetical protein [Microcoleus sp. PH2017_35_SFW_U_B]MCC3584427.1 hypothetical protein [Microcoleus sp. PH2017_30_WIL_O_A]